MLSKINLRYANRYTVKIRFILAVLLTVTFFCIQGQSKTDKLLSQNKSIKSGSISAPQDIVSELIDLLNDLSQNSDNSFFKQHCISIINVIEAENDLSSNELSFIDSLYTTFSDTSVYWNASELSSYLARKRPFIVSWTSPTDNIVSLGWLLLPENWNAEQTYPLYVSLHGLYDPYANPIEYMTRYLNPATVMGKSFEDGYSFFPWGRGNLWYEGISETDIWEGINVIENMIKVNPAKKYLMGHSMGGYGTWALGQKSPEIWAALGIYAGALQYGGYLNPETAEKLKDVPVYIVCGEQDGLLGDNQTAYQLLQDVENQNIFFTTFPGGHESLLENWQNMFAWMKQYTNDSQTSVDINDNSPLQYKLYNNYPNPFNPTTNIEFVIGILSDIELAVYDILGQKIRTLYTGNLPAGTYNADWDGKDANSVSVGSGIYFYQLKTGSIFVETKKMMLMK